MKDFNSYWNMQQIARKTASDGKQIITHMKFDKKVVNHLTQLANSDFISCISEICHAVRRAT